MEMFLLVLAVVLLLGVLIERASGTIGFPSLVGFVVAGWLLGPQMLHLLPGISEPVAEAVGVGALIIILFEGGLHTPLHRLHQVAVSSLLLATVGVLVSAAILGLLTWYLLDMAPLEAALVGVAVSSTDAAAVFALLGGTALRRRLVDVLEVESGTNDPMAVFLTLTLISWITTGTTIGAGQIGAAIGRFLLQMVVGAAVGVGLGYGASFLNQHIRLNTGGLYPVLALSCALLSYAVAQLVHGSGLLAVYVTAVTMGNRRMEHRHSILRFHEGLAWTMQILVFVVLGLFARPQQLLQIALPGLLLALAAVFLARPAAVFFSTVGQRFVLSERLFLSWAGLRGAVPIILALMSSTAGVPHADRVFDAVFFVVLLSTLLQGLTVAPLAHRLGLIEPQPTEELLELVRLTRESAIVLPVELTEGSPWAEKEMVDLPFPPNTLCYAIIREDGVVVPRGATQLHAGDHLLILTDRQQIERLRHLFRMDRVGGPAMLP
ncbi:MAG: potassium/proton antiporter [Firmicutes bacterium]|nr:potassium/proton antiporter [Bacillota bacterium]